jgi:sugar phosphate isomerase/epimerase
VHERISVNTLCFLGASLEEMADNWRALDPSQVAFVGTLAAQDPAAARAIVDAGGYRVATMVHPFSAGGPLSQDERTWAGPREMLSRGIEVAQAIGAESLYTLTGGHGNLTWEDAADAFSRAIAPCVEQAQAAGIPLSIENAGALYADHHITHTLRDTVILAEQAGVGVCFDIFAGWTEAGLRESITRAMPILNLVQIGDYVYGDRAMPCRAVVGDGDIPLKRIISWILEAGYEGPFDLEVLGPRIDAEGRLAATRRTAERLSEILAELGA